MLLDLIATRYPGTRPSDIYGRIDPTLPTDHPDNAGLLDEYQAFQLDAGLAWRYHNLEKQDAAQAVHELKESIKLTGRYHGVKNIKYRKFKGELGDTHDEDDDQEEGGGVYGGALGRGTAIE